VKNIARSIVNVKPEIASIFCPDTIAWCAKVIVAPEQSNNNVFRSGTAVALKTSKPFGGQIFPSSIAGAKLTAKKAQKKAKKNITSEIINKIIP
jgi:hypothetical protein